MSGRRSEQAGSGPERVTEGDQLYERCLPLVSLLIAEKNEISEEEFFAEDFSIVHLLDSVDYEDIDIGLITSALS